MDPCLRLEQCLAAIDEHDPRVRAWTLVDREAARRQAETLRKRALAGERLGPLAGSVWAVKDIFDVAGWPTRCGSRSLEEAPPATEDSAVVGWLRRSDAILLGKTHTAEFACFDPPVTRNPFDPARTPGGSSSGSAAAAAMGMCDAALGTQTGGSIIRPAAYCGVAGLMPRLDQIPSAGVSPVSYLLDHVGFLAPTAADLATLWSVWEGVASPPPRLPRRVLVAEPWWADSAAAPQRAAVRRWERAGVEAVSWRPAWDWEELRVVHRTLMAYEAHAWHGQRLQQADLLGKEFASLLREGAGLSARDFAEAVRRQRTFSQEVRRWADGDAWILTPAATGPAPSVATTGDPAYNSPWSLAGAAAVALPCGAVEGLPVGLQLAAPRQSEIELLGVAQSCERFAQPTEETGD